MMKNVLDDYVQNYRIRCLFRAVLLLAVKDAFGCRKTKKKNRKLKIEALEFFDGSDDLAYICQLGDVSYEKIVSVVKNENLKICEKYKKIILIILEKY
ncbi:MAG: hypothetical protein J6X42_04680 [Alphaproteobacteria bacterium]|nr:hypothetical protein [Alphaproteobacteria bacterium]